MRVAVNIGRPRASVEQYAGPERRYAERAAICMAGQRSRRPAARTYDDRGSDYGV